MLPLVSSAAGVSRLFSYSSACAFVANKNTRIEFIKVLVGFPVNRGITHDAFTSDKIPPEIIYEIFKAKHDQIVAGRD